MLLQHDASDRARRTQKLIFQQLTCRTNFAIEQVRLNELPDLEQ